MSVPAYGPPEPVRDRDGRFEPVQGENRKRGRDDQCDRDHGQAVAVAAGRFSARSWCVSAGEVEAAQIASDRPGGQHERGRDQLQPPAIDRDRGGQPDEERDPAPAAVCEVQRQQEQDAGPGGEAAHRPGRSAPRGRARAACPSRRGSRRRSSTHRIREAVAGDGVEDAEPLRKQPGREGRTSRPTVIAATTRRQQRRHGAAPEQHDARRPRRRRRRASARARGPSPGRCSSRAATARPRP